MTTGIDVEFFAPGIPVPQGSMRAFARGGRVVTTHSRAPALNAWRDAVHYEAARHIDTLIDGPVALRLTFRLLRPKSHYGAGRNREVLKPSAPRWPTSTPDIDKLGRAILDALTGVAYRDDAQVACLNMQKVYAGRNEQPGVLVRVTNA